MKFYPRPNSPLAPVLLLNLFSSIELTIDGLPLSYKNLTTAEVWSKVDADKVSRQVADNLVANCLRHLANPDNEKEFCAIRLPDLPDGRKIHEAGLPKGTYQRLVESGLVSRLESQRPTFIKDLWAVDRFGLKSLFSLLIFLESCSKDGRADRPLLSIATEIAADIRENVAWACSNLTYAEIFCALKGWDGKSGDKLTLRDAGLLFDYTHERVRQIRDQVQISLAKSQGSTKLGSAQKLADILANTHPCPLSVIAAELNCTDKVAAGLVDALLCLTQQPFDLRTIGDNQYVMPKSLPDAYIEQIEREAAALTLQNGIAHVSDIAAKVSQRVCDSIDAGTAKLILSYLPNVQWFNSDSDWLSMQGALGKNAAFNRVEKFYSLAIEAGPVRLSDLRRAVGKSIPAFMDLPMPVLSWLLGQYDYSVNSNETVTRHTDRPLPALSRIEQIMVDILRSLGGSASRSSFLEACIDRGVSAPTFYSYLNKSMAFNVRSGVCTLAA